MILVFFLRINEDESLRSTKGRITMEFRKVQLHRVRITKDYASHVVA
jgi:hypothetical protein